jgi:hypothetical protein
MADHRTAEHRGALSFLSRESPSGRRNSLGQADMIHNAGIQQPMTPPRAFTSATMEGLRHADNGTINARDLIGMMHPSQEVAWRPQLGGGRRQIRTGRNFQVPDSDHPNEHFVVRIHTNDNTIADRDANSYSHAVVRIQSSHTGRYLMGGASHSAAVGAAAWSGGHATQAEINAAHIPVPGRGRR